MQAQAEKIFLDQNQSSALLRGRFAADCCTQSRKAAKPRKETPEAFFHAFGV
jgi:hypothetical protein